MRAVYLLGSFTLLELFVCDEAKEHSQKALKSSLALWFDISEDDWLKWLNGPQQAAAEVEVADETTTEDVQYIGTLDSDIV